jgi:hypothetical protein
MDLAYTKPMSLQLQLSAFHTSAIFIIRNPWNAFFAEYQRLFIFKHIRRYKKNSSYYSPNNGHIQHVLLADFGLKYFVGFLKEHVRRLVIIIDEYWDYLQSTNLNVILIVFELLTDIQFANAEIWKLLSFLINDEYFKFNHQQNNRRLYQHRIDCILYDKSQSLPRSNHIRRTKLNVNENNSSSSTLTSTEEYLTKEYAYSMVSEVQICGMWRELRPYFSKLDLIKYGYHPTQTFKKDYNC